ncbi:glucose-methanol-choline oxidoreductase [Colletotrichum incanum]|nr:glucose-methanol-choline oxidoreductase [Colletotrichum incanum]
MLVPYQVAPGADVANDGDNAISKYVKGTTVPNGHASGLNRMLLIEYGDVTDLCLRLHGVNDRRVVDSSIVPTVPDVML